jgi:hypothetical protein
LSLLKLLHIISKRSPIGKPIDISFIRNAIKTKKK